MRYGRFACFVAGLVLSGVAAAKDFSFTGTFADHNDVQFFTFGVATMSDVTLRTWSYAGGVNSAGATIARGGFDPILALFDSSGVLIDENDDGGGNVPADSVTGDRFDTFLQSSLTPGSYTVSVMDYRNFANGPNLSNGFTGGALSPGFIDVAGDQRDNHWAFDVLNVDSAVVPEPGTYTMMVAGLGLVSFLARRRRPQDAA